MLVGFINVRPSTAGYSLGRRSFRYQNERNLLSRRRYDHVTAESMLNVDVQSKAGYFNGGNKKKAISVAVEGAIGAIVPLNILVLSLFTAKQ